MSMKRGGGATSCTLFVGDLFDIPLFNDSVDIVYTSHSIEPNGGKEEEALRELYRVTKNYLILLEPAYEFANEDARNRMVAHGYVKNLYATAKSLGYKILTYELYGVSTNPLNPTGLMIIEKNPDNNLSSTMPFCDPITKTKLSVRGNVYFSEEGLISYPIVNGVPCLMKDYAIITTKMAHFYQ